MQAEQAAGTIVQASNGVAHPGLNEDLAAEVLLLAERSMEKAFFLPIASLSTLGANGWMLLAACVLVTPAVDPEALSGCPLHATPSGIAGSA